MASTETLSCFFLITPTTVSLTLSLHDALPICRQDVPRDPHLSQVGPRGSLAGAAPRHVREPRSRGRESQRAQQRRFSRSEEHTSELQSLTNLVCRLLLEKKKQQKSRYKFSDNT